MRNQLRAAANIDSLMKRYGLIYGETEQSQLLQLEDAKTSMQRLFHGKTPR
jgi:hypothetical protein